MRISSESVATSYVETTRYFGNNIVRKNETGAEFQLKFLSRSDVQKTVKNDLGFRPMTAYKAMVIDDFPCSYTAVGTSYYAGAPQYEVTGEGTMNHSYNSLFGVKLLTPGLFNQKNKTLLVNGAFIKLKEQSVNLALTLSFIPETTGMIKRMADKLRRAYLFIKRGRWKAAADVLGLRFLDDIRDNYLEILFGWMQLARDLQGAVELLSDLSRPKMYYVYGRSKWENKRKQYVSANAYTWTLSLKYSATLDVKSTQKCIVIAQVTSEGLHSLKRSGAINPLLIMWDMLRWTWVLDQFVSIGQYLDAYDAMAGLEYCTGSYLEYSEVSGVVNTEPAVQSTYPANQSGWTYGMESNAPGFISRKNMNRELVTPADIGVTIKNPFHMNVAIAAAAVAALNQVVRKGGPLPKLAGTSSIR